MPRGLRKAPWARDRCRRACPLRSLMPTTPVVRTMTHPHRVKDTARRRRLPRSQEARSPQGTGPSSFSNLKQRRGCPAAAASAQRPFFHNLHSSARLAQASHALKHRQASRFVLGCPAPSRVCPRTSTGRFGVHVRSGGRLSRAATHLWLAQAGRVACGHSRDGSFLCLVSSME